jgi:3-hydroxyacyl-CoA dehydrogenase
MGTRLALRCAAHGCATTLVARDVRRAESALADAARESGLPAERVAIAERLSAVAEAELVAELLPEDREAKQRLYAELEPLLDSHVPIASGTSTFVPDALGARLANRGRLVVAHMVHPVTLVPIVEVVPSQNVDALALATVERWIATIAMRAIRLRAPVAGFIVNRLQFALLREAASLVERGIVAPEDVDTVIERALGPRWAATGPFASVELGGLATFAAVAHHLVPDLDARAAIPLFERPTPLRAWTPDERDAARARRIAIYEAIERATTSPLR